MGTPAKFKKIWVKSLDGLYDEDSEARLYPINERKRCWIHKFVNASLYWQSETFPDGSYFSMHIEDHEHEAHGQHQIGWGGGYGGIRFCVKCKHIDCLHVWEEETKSYHIDKGGFFDFYHVDKCRICGLRILRGGMRVDKQCEDTCHPI